MVTRRAVGAVAVGIDERQEDSLRKERASEREQRVRVDAWRAPLYSTWQRQWVATPPLRVRRHHRYITRHVAISHFTFY